MAPVASGESPRVAQVTRSINPQRLPHSGPGVLTPGQAGAQAATLSAIALADDR